MPPLLLGHRGARASRHIPENTLESFERCLQQGCDGFEFDVRRTADGVPVICHDPVVRGLEIAKTASSILSLPALGAVLSQLSSRAFLDIELKVIGVERELIAALAQYPAQKGYVVSSFLPAVLSAVHQVGPGIPTGLISETTDQLQQWRASPTQWVIPNVKLANRNLVDQLHSAGKKVMIWTVNDADQMREVAAWGADAVISDQTELLCRVLS